MNKVEKWLPYLDLISVWMECPWGIAVIGMDGTVRAVNRSFETCTRLTEHNVVGKSEAKFDELVLSQLANGIGFRRIRKLSKSIDLRAIHYFSGATDSDSQNDLNNSMSELLREPLTSIYGFAELLLSQNYDEDTRRDLCSTLLHQADLMINIMNSNLDESAK